MTHSPSPQDWRRRRRVLQEFLRRHHAVVGTTELKERLGFSSSGLGRLLGDGTLIEAHHKRVYVSGTAPLTDLGRLRIELVRAGPRAALTGQAAAYLLGHLARFPSELEVAVPRASGFAKGDGRVAAPNMRELDVVVRNGLRCMNATQTALRLAAKAAAKDATEADRRVLRRLLRGAANADPSLVPRLRLLVDGERFAGRSILKQEILGGVDRTRIIRSDLEDEFVEFCKQHGLPIPQTNVMVHGWELDAWFPQFQRYAEISPYATHGDEISHERDQQRRAALARVGIFGIDVSERRMRHDARALAADLRGLLR